MNPLTELQRGLLKLAIGVLVLMGAAWALYSNGVEAGAASVQAKWDNAQLAQKRAETALLLKHVEDIGKQAKLYRDINLKVSQDHEQEIQQLRNARDRDRAAVERAGGLRIPAPACPGTAAANAETNGTSGRDEARAGTIRLPLALENSLWSLADDADEVSAQLRSCQAWIHQNGFYGTPPSDSTRLLDRMIAAPNQSAEETLP